MYSEGMSRPPTYDDVNLILRLYEMRREEKMRAARDWFGSEFKAKTFEEAAELAPQGSQNNAYLRMVTSYWDMVASFINSGVLHDELFFESGYEMAICWEKMRDIAPVIREMFKNPLYLKNLEEAAKRFEKSLDRRVPGAYESMSKMARG
jgi:hypothetical protein